MKSEQNKKFENINIDFINDMLDVFSKISQIQKKYQKKDFDTLLNETHDSIIAKFLGFQLINKEKHGMDAKLNNSKNIFLESKVISYNTSNWHATFNDTTFEKVESFSNNNIILAVSIWKDIGKPYCIIFGRTRKIADLLKAGVQRFKEGKIARSTQTIGIPKLIFDFDFKILSLAKSKKELMKDLILKNKNFSKIKSDSIIQFSKFTNVFDYC